MLEKLQTFYEEYCRDIRREADLLRDKRMPRLTEELFAIFENTGNRLIYEEVYFLRRKYLAVFGLKVVLDRKEEDLAKLEEVLADICEEECWALPAHVNRKQDANWRICVDLFAAETAQTLSEITFLLKKELSGEMRERVREEVMRRVLIPFSQSEAPYGNWEYSTHNWCAVCGGSIGSAAMYLLGEVPQWQEELGRILERICYSLEHYYLAGFAEDGACLEGLGYFTYGMTYFVGFAEQLYSFTGGKRDLFQIEKLKKIAAFQSKCYFSGGRTVSFADGFTSDRFRPGLTCYLALQYPEARIPDLGQAARLKEDNCYRWMALYRNLTWVKLYMDKRKQGESSWAEEEMHYGQEVLPDAQWVICQSKNGAGMAAKGGHNNEPHNHNDVGSFFYLKGGDFLLSDLGCGEYTRDYFAEGRYQYLCCRSLGHNVPLIDGKEQKAGKEYGCDDFAAYEQTQAAQQTGETGQAQAAPGHAATVISFGKAYGNPGLESLIRTLDWNEEDGTLRVEDRYQVNDRIQSIRENLVTQWKPVVQAGSIQIVGEKEGCRILVEDPKVQIECIRKDFSDHGGVRRDVWLLQWEVPIKEGGACSSFTVQPLSS